MVLPDAPYARFTVDDLIQMPGHEGLPIIDTDRPPKHLLVIFNIFIVIFRFIFLYHKYISNLNLNQFCRFKADNCLGLSASETIKLYIPEAHPNWSLTSDYIRRILLKCFAVRFNF